MPDPTLTLEPDLSLPDQSQPDPSLQDLSVKAKDILYAAQELFIEKGFGPASMDAVAKAAGVSKATVYAHFRSKDELFAAIVGQIAERLTGEIRRVMEDRLPLRQALTRIGLRFLDVLTDRKRVRMFRMIVAEADRFPELGRVFYRAGPVMMQDCLAGFLRDSAAAGALVLPDSALAAKQFLSLIKSDLHLRCMFEVDANPSQDERNVQVAAAVEMFLKAYGVTTP
jgi:TetR/AcrR family transcriptional repressor of mexJK operon